MQPSNRTQPLAALLLAFTLLVAMHGAATPLFEAPDEIWHYAYVRWLVAGHGLPSLENDASGANQEAAQPPLYYAAAALLSRPFDDAGIDELVWGNPGFGHQAPGTTADNKNMLIHTERERWPWRGAVLAVHAARLASLGFGLIAVIAAWGLGYETFGHRRGALVTAAAVAFHPQFVFICSVVNNDSAAAAFATAGLWMAARILRRGPTLRRAALGGIFTGLAILSKTSPLPLIGLLGCAILWAGYRRRIPWGRVVAAGLLLGAIAALVGGWWYARNLVLYGDPLGISQHVDTPWGRTALASLPELLAEFPLLVRSFWGAYGWGHVTWPTWVYAALTVTGLTFAVRGGLYEARRIRRAGAGPRTAALAGAALWLGGIFALLLHWMRQVEAPHGRLLFPALGAWALLVANGIVAPPGRRLPARAYLAALATLSALAPGARILATFAPPRLYPPEAVGGELAGAEFIYGDRARLLGIVPPEGRVAPGESFIVRACWEGLRPMDENYTVFVHLLGPGNSRVAERHTYPGLGRLPTSLWPVGRAFCDDYRVAVEPWAEAPARYPLSVGLFDAESGARLPAAHPGGGAAEPPIAGAVIVAAGSEAPFPPAGITWERAPEESPGFLLGAEPVADVLLRGADFPAAAAPGEAITITLYWEARTAPARDLIAFVHLWEPGAPEPLAQHDAPPRAGWFPTSAWQPGDHVADPHPLTLPAGLPPGRYPLWAGLYAPEDGARPPALEPEGSLPYNMIPLGEIEVAP